MRISGNIGPPPGLIMADDDEDEDSIPPEILDMIRMTEMMASRSGFGGLPGMQLGRPGSPKKEVDNTPRHEEPIEDIMARMNKLSDEIG